VAALSTNDVWAVGGTIISGSTSQTYSQHWDGRRWTAVASPNVGSTNSLSAVAALASNDVWAVGSYASVTQSYTLIEHWNGTAWSVVPSANYPISNTLLGVAAITPNDVWAVGEHNLGGNDGTIAEHWDGTTWRIVTTPDPGTIFNAFWAISAISTNDIWAVGDTQTTGSDAQPLIEHWDGSVWKVVPGASLFSTSQLLSVSAAASNDVWAVGWGNGYGWITEHWDGNTWTLSVPVINDNVAFGVVTLSPSDVWAVGNNAPGTTQIEHWDGTTWSQVKSPGYGDLDAIASGAEGDFWAVGQDVSAQTATTLHLCGIDVTDTGFSRPSATAALGDTVVWRFDPANTKNHTVLDNSGMGIFNSGQKPPNSEFLFTFIAAGSYPVVDRVDLATETVNVPIQAIPKNGTCGSVYSVTWASATAPAGFVYDVQIMRPGSSVWVDWLTDQTGATANFQPDAGSGKYRFQARMRVTRTGASSGWSPSASITCS
jgi:hypothetical protein